MTEMPRSIAGDRKDEQTMYSYVNSRVASTSLSLLPDSRATRSPGILRADGG